MALNELDRLSKNHILSLQGLNILLLIKSSKNDSHDVSEDAVTKVRDFLFSTRCYLYYKLKKKKRR